MDFNILWTWTCILLFIPTAIAKPLITEQDDIRSDPEAIPENYRLHNELLPSNYDIELILDDDFFKAKVFLGVVKITLSPKPDFDTTNQNLMVHMKKLTLDNVEEVKLYEEKTSLNLLDKTKMMNDETLERLNLWINAPLSTNKKYVLRIKYTGILQEDETGFYLSSYVNDNNGTEWLAATHFEATHARKVFPCFDEPQYKSTFNIKISHPKQYQVISNAEIKTTDIVKGKLRTTFQQTQKMSTHLVGFVVSRFAAMSVITDDIGKNSAWVRKQLIPSTFYGFDVAVKIAKHMSELTGISYSTSVTKMDQVAISNFPLLAAGYWGLFCYSENTFLWHPYESALKQKQNVLTTIAHHIAHTWFGHLVTLQWWSDYWLHKGLAAYFEYHAAEGIETEFELSHQFVVEKHQSALKSDSLSTIQPFWSSESDILTPLQIINKVGSVSYNRGGSIIRMLRHFIGAKSFINGIKSYLTKYQLTNSKPSDLWIIFQNLFDGRVKLPDTVENIMNTWTNQTGFPLISVSLSGNDVTLDQQKFVFTHTIKNDENSSWYIPISYTTSDQKVFDETMPQLWIKPEEGSSIANVVKDESTWIILNIQDSAYIRVNYDRQLWNALEDALNKPDFDGIHVLNRAKIVDDSMNIARAGILDYNIAFDVIAYLKQELSYYPWYSAFNAFSFLKERFSNDADVSELLDTYITKLMKNFYDDSLIKNDSNNQVDVYKKVLALRWACLLNNKACIENAQQQFDLLVKEGKQIDPNMRRFIYCTVLRNSNNEDDWIFLRARLDTTALVLESSDIISALGCSRNQQLLETYLESSFQTTSMIRKQDAFSVFQSVVSENPEGIDVALKFLQSHKLDEIKNRYGGKEGLSSIVIELADRLSSNTQIEEFKKLISDNKEELGKTADDTTIIYKGNQIWIAKHKETIRNYLNSKIKNTSEIATITIITNTTKFYATTPQNNFNDHSSNSGNSVAENAFFIFTTFTITYQLL